MESGIGQIEKDDMKTPVLLIVYNRLDQVREVFDSVRRYQPDNLFIFADGANTDRVGDLAKCSCVRSWLLENVDWDCCLKTKFMDKNLGCGLGPSTAITWFFENVDAGIILEDDCVPHQDFYEFANQMLVKFKYDESVMAVNSSNFQAERIGSGSYYFSMQNGPFCAWATWKRAWTHFDYELVKYTKSTIWRALLFHYRATRRERRWWLDIYDSLMSDQYDGSSWDYQFIFAIWALQGKSIVPNSNLSSNIGFGPDATHTTNENSVTANRATHAILPILHTDDLAISRKADLYYHDLYYDKFVEHLTLKTRAKRFIKKLIRKIKRL